MRDLREKMAQHIDDARCGERLRVGVNVALIGQPDVGKSSLLNALCRRQAAIVAAGAGTTRDIIEVSADVGGFPVIFRDTAGLRFGPDVGEVEREVGLGVRGENRAIFPFKAGSKHIQQQQQQHLGGAEGTKGRRDIGLVRVCAGREPGRAVPERGWGRRLLLPRARRRRDGGGPQQN